MANPDQKTILLEQAYEEIKFIWINSQEKPAVQNMEEKLY